MFESCRSFSCSLTVAVTRVWHSGRCLQVQRTQDCQTTSRPGPEQYVHFHAKAGAAHKNNKASGAIVARQQLADKIRVARAGAKQGEIFSSEIAQYFRRQIAASLRGPHGKEILASLRHAEPVKMALEINQSYPENVPLQSTPPTLLLNLPTLPDGLEYRILDRELVLRDTEAKMVVDYIPNALPEPTK